VRNELASESLDFVSSAWPHTLHLTADTTRQTIPARALWVAAPLSEKQTVQSVLFPDGICYRKDTGFFAPVTNELEASVFKMLVELSEHGEDYKVSDLRHR
jgi:hypothetical protein